jgi:NAD(P)-dependent dehydrogenase (short-subunit alcohol dehydrogenase family)
MTKCLAVDFGKRGITVNVVAPGGVKTDMYENVAKEYIKGGENMTIEEIDGHISKMSPLGRPGLTSDVAGVVAFIAGPDSQWLTGQTLHVSGGAHMAS